MMSAPRGDGRGAGRTRGADLHVRHAVLGVGLGAVAAAFDRGHEIAQRDLVVAAIFRSLLLPPSLILAPLPLEAPGGACRGVLRHRRHGPLKALGV